MDRVALLALIGSLGLSSCTSDSGPDGSAVAPPADAPYLVVLGIGQDGGYPQAGTAPGPAWSPGRRRFATSVAVVDPASGERWLFEASPDFRDQLRELDRIAPSDGIPGLQGIFLTHAHVGHYAGLIHLGREIIGADAVPVFAMPRMGAFLSSNGPWDQLVRLGNIEIRGMREGRRVRLNDRVAVTPIRVPHRDEYSETVAFRIEGPDRSVLFLPDIDKWERWEAEGRRIEDLVRDADIAYLDGTFFRDGEVPGRSMTEIPHPFIVETMERFRGMDPAVRGRIRFIHLNRTNPALFPDSDARRFIEGEGFRVAGRLEITPL